MKIVRYEIGDEVIAISSNDERIVVGKQYTVIDTLFCSKCGCQNINTGLTQRFHRLNCTKCNTATSDNYRKLWTGSFRFVKVDDIESAIDQAVNSENYELAQLLTEHLTVNI